MIQSRPAPESAYLVHSETTSGPLGHQSRAQFRIHAPVRALREQTINALWFSEDPRLTHRAKKIGMCCIAPTVYVGTGCKPTCSPGRCRDRLCPTCAIFRAGSLRSRLNKLLHRANAIRFVTLTMAPVSSDLAACVDALHAAMRALRASPEWKAHVTGGVFVVEVTRGFDGGHWHVHAHLLIDGVYFPHSDLHQAWCRATGAQSRVEIKAVHDRNAAAGYVTKYLAKGTGVEAWTADQICEFALGMHRRRTVGTFGKWHRCKVDALDVEPDRPAKAEYDIDFVVVEEVLLADKGLARAVAPLLSRLSRTWRLLMEPFRSGIEWLDAPLDEGGLRDLTIVLLELRGYLLEGPIDPAQTRRAAIAAANARRVKDKRRQILIPHQHDPHA